jgi:hypothetical protein
MIPKELADQVRAEAHALKEAGDRFLQTYARLCDHHGGPGWQRGQTEVVFHQVRREVIPILQQAGMTDKSVQALCSWAEKMVMAR